MTYKKYCDDDYLDIIAWLPNTFSFAPTNEQNYKCLSSFFFTNFPQLHQALKLIEYFKLNEIILFSVSLENYRTHKLHRDFCFVFAFCFDPNLIKLKYSSGQKKK